MRAEVIPRRFHRNGICSDRNIVEFLCCTAIDQDKDRADDLTSPEPWHGFTGDYFALVGIVVQNSPELL